MFWGGITPEMMAAMSNGTYEAPATKEAVQKKEHDAAEAKKSDEEKLADGFRACKEAGHKLPKRLLGIVDRETGKLTDQFTILEDHAEKVSEIVMEEFLNQLDIELEERGLIDDE